MAYLPSIDRTITIPIPGVFISGAATDRAMAFLPTYVTKWVPEQILVYCENTGASIAAASVEIWTTGVAGNVGTSLMASTPVTLSNMSTTGKFQTITGLAAGSIFTASGILIRQNGSAGGGSATGSCYFGVIINVLG